MAKIYFIGIVLVLVLIVGCTSTTTSQRNLVEAPPKITIPSAPIEENMSQTYEDLQSAQDSFEAIEKALENIE